MNDKPAILVGLVVFLALATLPTWYTFGASALFSTDPAKPDLPAPAGALEFSAAWSGDSPDLAVLGNMFRDHGLASLTSDAVFTADTAGGKWRVFDGQRRYLVLHDESQGTLQVYDGCVEDVEFMRSEHMSLLIEWREGVIRYGDTSTVEVNGKAYAKSLVKTCLACHTDQQAFCNECHTFANTLPAWPARSNAIDEGGIRCWNCHLQPDGEANDG